MGASLILSYFPARVKPFLKNRGKIPSPDKKRGGAGIRLRPPGKAADQSRCSTGYTARLSTPEATNPAAASTAPCTPTNSSTKTKGLAAPRAVT